VKASKVKSADQKKAFIEAARALGCDESEPALDAALKRVTHLKPPIPPKKRRPKK
jgi:hypothetical protein